MRNHNGSLLIRRLALLGAFLLPLAALATPPRTPITVKLTIPNSPRLLQPGTLVVQVTSTDDAPDTVVELVLPEGVFADETRWIVDLESGASRRLATRFTITTAALGNVTLSARAYKEIAPGTVWGDMKSIPLHIGITEVQRGWKVDVVPVGELGVPGDAPPLSMDPTPFTGGKAKIIPPGVSPAAQGSPIPSLGVDGTVTLTGRWRYYDRAGILRDIDQQLIEIRRGDGTALSSRIFCYTNWDGTFSCSFTHPGTTFRVWLRSWTNLNPGPTRLGVFQGIETGGCGSDSIDCSYSVQSAEVSCPDGQTCNTGTWYILTNTAEPWRGAHLMEQDLIRSWKKLYYGVVHPAGSNNPGPGRITYPVPSGHGTHVHVAGRDPWISVEPPNQQSADVVTHEYGHAVMSNLYAGFSPSWPTSDCPSPHYVNKASGPGCALIEGFANFWAWYSNELYDGDGTTANDGPVFNWPGGASTNLETRDGNTYDAGDWVEGNVAGALGDFFDASNDGNDKLNEGIQHIWHTTWSQSDSNFAQWWNAYWGTFGHNACPARDTLHWNTIVYSTPTCP